MDDVIKYLNDHVGGEASTVQTFGVYISGREVRVELRDHGPGTGRNRFSAEAYDLDVPRQDRGVNSDGHSIGNPGPTVEEALEGVHWNVFGERD